jgi:hypothetical protein
MDDREAYEFYESQPERLALRGTPTARSGAALSTHVPVRFSPNVIARVRVLAERDGTTVSGWIRRVVEEAVERRMPAAPQTHGWKIDGLVTWAKRPSEPASATRSVGHLSAELVAAS